MADRKKAINGLECCLKTDSMVECQITECPYHECREACTEMLMKNVLSLLKAQEPVKPYIDYDGQDVWRCGSCGATLFHLSHTQADENEQNCVKFCRYCGKAVRWE